MILDCLNLHLKPRNEANIICFWKSPLLNVTLEKNESRHDGPTGPLKTNTLSLYGSCHLAPRLISSFARLIVKQDTAKKLTEGVSHTQSHISHSHTRIQRVSLMSSSREVVFCQ